MWLFRSVFWLVRNSTDFFVTCKSNNDFLKSLGVHLQKNAETTVSVLMLSSFVAVRIGWYHPNPPKTITYHRLAIGTLDLRSLFRCCVEAEFEGFQVVYGVSAQRISPYDLSYTCQLLSWEPNRRLVALAPLVQAGRST